MNHREARLRFLLLQGGLHAGIEPLPIVHRESSQVIRGQWGSAISTITSTQQPGILIFHLNNLLIGCLSRNHAVADIWTVWELLSAYLNPL